MSDGDKLIDLLEFTIETIRNNPDKIHHIALFVAIQEPTDDGMAEVKTAREVWGCPECLPPDLLTTAIKLAKIAQDKRLANEMENARAEEITSSLLARAARKGEEK